MFAHSLLKNLKTQLYQSVYRKPLPLRLDRGIVSITYDDVPHSALENGVPALEAAGYKATFYVVGSLATAKTEALKSDYITLDEARVLQRNGHHIGCHSFSHQKPRGGIDHEYIRDAVKNRDLLATELGVPIRHFSYPFGAVTLGVKRKMANEYTSLRSIRAGVNEGTVDLSLLLAISVYSSSIDKERVGSLLKIARERRGWLIFYTHAVETPPPAYGVSIADFNWLLTQISRSHCDVLTVQEAYGRISGLRD